MSRLTFAAAYEMWESEIKPLVVEQYGEDDECALSESWNDYTDALCKDGEFTDLQYYYCPAWDDSMPDDDYEFILESMGVVITTNGISVRPDGVDDWPQGSSHWIVIIDRGEVSEIFYYSMGPAHKGEPVEADIFYSLLVETVCVDGYTLDEWANTFGFDAENVKAIRMYEACQEELIQLNRLFSVQEIAELRELFEDY